MVHFSARSNLIHSISLLNCNVFGFGHQILLWFTQFRRDDNFSFPAAIFAEVNDTINITDLSRILRLTSFKQFDNSR